MTSVSVKVDTRRIEALLNGLGPAAEKVIDVAAANIEGSWKKSIVDKNVIDTGAYLNSVHVESGHKPFERTIADGVDYGIYQEFGHHNIAARPCATPALEFEREPFIRAWRAMLK